MIDKNEISKNYPQPKNTTYLNTSSCGLVSKSCIDEAQLFNEKLHSHGSKQAEDFFINEISKVRKSIGDFINASLNEIALIPNFSYGLNAVLPSLSTLNRVLLFKDDYPSLTIPFTLNDFEIFWIDSSDGFSIDLDELEQSITKNKIEILAISHVQYLTGYKIDLEQLSAICAAHEVLLILDGTQSLGAFPFSFKNSGVNIYITSNYKWMNGGFGTGIMCIDPQTLNRFPPKIGGFNSFKYIEKAWNYHASISSYEPGHLNMAGLALVINAIDYKIALGIENIAAHNLNLVNYLTEKISSTPCQLVGPPSNENRASIVSFYGNKNLEKFLIDQGITVKMWNGMIRIGLHFYNSKQDVDKLIGGLRNQG